MFADISFPSSDIDNFVSTFFNRYRIEILALHTKATTEEGIKEYSDKYLKSAQYYLAMYLAILIYQDFKTGAFTWDELYIKYKIDKHTQELACCEIDLDEILAMVGLPPQANIGGIEAMEVEASLEIEPIVFPTASTSSTIDIPYYLEHREECFNYTSTDNC